MTTTPDLETRVTALEERVQGMTSRFGEARSDLVWSNAQLELAEARLAGLRKDLLAWRDLLVEARDAIPDADEHSRWKLEYVIERFDRRIRDM